MTVIVCVLGGAIGLVVAFAARRWALPSALRSQEAHIRDGRMDTFGVPAPAFLRDPQRMRRLTIFAYRYWIPAVFAFVGAAAAYHIYNGGAQ